MQTLREGDVYACNFKKQYNSLPIEEKLRRMEWVAICYASYLDCGNWEELPMLDCTKYWEDFEETLKEHLDNPQK